MNSTGDQNTCQKNPFKFKHNFIKESWNIMFYVDEVLIVLSFLCNIVIRKVENIQHFILVLKQTVKIIENTEMVMCIFYFLQSLWNF